MLSINPKLTQVELSAKLERIQNTAFSFSCLDTWLKHNLDCFGVATQSNNEVEVSLFSTDMRNLSWDNKSKTGTFAAKVRINITEIAEDASGIHAFFSDAEQFSFANILMMQQWYLPLDKWPCVTIEILSHCMRNFSRNSVFLEFEKDVLDHLIPLHFPGFTLDRILALHHAGLLPEDGGKYTVQTLGPFLMHSRPSEVLTDGGNKLPTDMVGPAYG